MYGTDRQPRGVNAADTQTKISLSLAAFTIHPSGLISHRLQNYGKKQNILEVAAGFADSACQAIKYIFDDPSQTGFGMVGCPWDRRGTRLGLRGELKAVDYCWVDSFIYPDAQRRPQNKRYRRDTTLKERFGIINRPVVGAFGTARLKSCGSRKAGGNARIPTNSFVTNLPSLNKIENDRLARLNEALFCPVSICTAPS